jgi:SAM-dependent methyltransferase
MSIQSFGKHQDSLFLKSMSNNYHDTRFTFDKNRAKVWKAINQYLQKYIGFNKAILDIGCGYGDFITGIQAAKKHAIDLNPDLKSYFPADVMYHCQSVLVSFDQIESKTIDVVFASNLFEHFNDEELIQLLTNIKKVLKENGKIVLIQPNYFYAYREYWDDYTHKKAFSHNSLKDFLESQGFLVSHMEKKFIPFSLKSRLPKSYWLTKMYLKSPVRIFAKQMMLMAELKNKD